MYGINKMEPTINPMMQYQFGGQQYGPQAGFQQPNQQQVQPQQQPTGSAFWNRNNVAGSPNNPIEQPFSSAPQQNALAPQGHFQTISPNFNMPDFGNKASTGQEVFKPGGKFYDPNVPMYAAPNRG